MLDGAPELRFYVSVPANRDIDKNSARMDFSFDDFKKSTTLNIDLKLTSSPASLTAAVDGKTWSVQAMGGKVIYDAKLSALSYVSAVLDARRNNPTEAQALTAFYRCYEAAKAFE